MVTWFRRGDFPEPPPPEAAGLPLAGGYTVVEHDDPDEIDRAGRAAGVSASDTWNTHKIASFVDPATATMHLLSKRATGDDDLWQARYAHEVPHTYGLVHDQTGRNWDGPPEAWAKIRMIKALNALNAAKPQLDTLQHPPSILAQAQTTSPQISVPIPPSIADPGSSGALTN